MITDVSKFLSNIPSAINYDEDPDLLQYTDTDVS